jgi:DNA-binding HxlR family transcriptional regulator
VDDCYDFAADCRVRLAAELLAHTWDPVVLVALRPGPLRRRDLLAAVGGASDKLLTEALGRLTGSGLVHRAEGSTPRRAVYALTALGESFVHGPLAALGRWALEHSDEVLDARLAGSA